MKWMQIAAAAILLGGCATYNPIPEGYSGPTAVIKDTFSNKTNTRAHYFELSQIDGNYVRTSFGETRSKYYGMGLYFEPVMMEHEVLPKMQSFSISGYVFFPTDIQILMGDTLDVRGTVNFEPKAGETYFVKGEIGDDVSRVWIEDSGGNVVGTKLSKDHKK